MNIDAQAIVNAISAQRNRAMDDAAQLNAALETALKRISELEAKLKDKDSGRNPETPAQ
jgi:hypothetical protein